MSEHIPVLVAKVIDFLKVRKGGRYIDATVGGGGHTRAILKKGGEVLGIDYSPDALRISKKRLKACPGVFKLSLGNFSNLTEIARSFGFAKADGVLFDLGVASFQLEDASSGLSFMKKGPLDMRLDKTLAVKASDLVNSLHQKELYRLFWEFGQEDRAREISREIAKRRRLKRFERTEQLRDLIAEVYREIPNYKHQITKRIHPATKVFMALRIAVNLELENLKKALPQAFGILKKGGRLVVVSFHSGEDRLVKRFMLALKKQGKVVILTKKPVLPSGLEIRKNPKARSAKLRALEKI